MSDEDSDEERMLDQLARQQFFRLRNTYRLSRGMNAARRRISTPTTRSWIAIAREATNKIDTLREELNDLVEANVRRSINAGQLIVSRRDLIRARMIHTRIHYWRNRLIEARRNMPFLSALEELGSSSDDEE